MHIQINRQEYLYLTNNEASVKIQKSVFIQGKLQKSCSAGEVVEISSIVTLATLDTMLRCALSYKGHIQEKGWVNNQ